MAANDDSSQYDSHSIGGLFLEESAPASFVSLIYPEKNSLCATVSCSSARSRRRGLIGSGRRRRGGFLSVTLSSTNDCGAGGEGSPGDELSVSSVLGNVAEKRVESENEGESETLSLKEVVGEEKSGVLREGGGGTLNTAKHLWAGAVAAMVSRSVLFLHYFSYNCM